VISHPPSSQIKSSWQGPIFRRFFLRKIPRKIPPPSPKKMSGKIRIFRVKKNLIVIKEIPRKIVRNVIFSRKNVPKISPRYWADSFTIGKPLGDFMKKIAPKTKNIAQSSHTHFFGHPGRRSENCTN
jgi:hypothetical protein